MKQAREAWLRQQCGSAVDLSRKALHAKPGMTDAYQIIAVCSCTLKDADAAGRAYAKLDDKNRNLVRHALPEERHQRRRVARLARGLLRACCPRAG